MSLAWRSQWLLCKKAGSGGFGACFAEFSRKGGVVRLGHGLSASSKNQQLLVSLQTASLGFARARRRAAIRAIPRKVVAHLLAIPTASSALREL